MGDFSKIQWTTHTFNPWIGCHKVSAECKHCYAEVETFARRERARGLELWGVDAARHVTSDANWRKPIAWNKAAVKAGERHRVFCASMADVFEDRPELVGPRARLWKLIAETPNLDWLLLTKRPENAHRLARLAALHAWDGGGPDAPTWLPNIWLGTSVGTQATADERIPHLLRAPAKVRFLSCEPLLERVDLNPPTCPTCDGHEYVLGDDGATPFCPEHEDEMCFGAWLDPCADEGQAGINWVIIGGESGPGARPCDVRWIRSLVKQCRDAGVAPFVKQLGACASDPENGLAGASLKVPKDALPLVSRRLVDKKGGDPDEWPEDLRVREVPLRAALRLAPGTDGPLFASWGNVRRDLHAACARAGVDPVSPNDLRRSYASYLHQLGVPTLSLSRLLGHADARMVGRVYGQDTTASLAETLRRAR